MSTGGKWLRTSFIWLILALALVLIIVVFFRPSSDTNSVNVSTILNDIKMDMAKNQKDTLSVSTNAITLTRGQISTKEVANINDTFDITQVLKDNGIDYTNSQLLVLQYESPSALGTWLNILGGLIPFILIGGLLLFMMRQAQGSNNQALSFGKSRARMFMGNKSTVTFVDEIDAVGRQRGAGLGGSHDEREQTLNQILVEMDGFDTNTNVIVIAATNRPDVLDPALLRPGRFDRQVVLDRPDIRGRSSILQVHAKGKPLETSVTLETLAKQTPGFSGADLANLLNEAAILAARRNKRKIGMSELEEAIDRVVAGPARKSRIISEREKAITAYHEVGHALVARMLPNTDPVHKVSIVARGQAGGFTMLLPTEDRYLWSKPQFEDMLAYALGGHVAELIIFGEVTTGASNAIERVTKIARSMVTEYGMSSRIGPMALGHKDELVFLGRDFGEQRNYSEQTAREIDEEIRRIIQEAFDKAYHVLQQS